MFNGITKRYHRLNGDEKKEFRLVLLLDLILLLFGVGELFNHVLGAGGSLSAFPGTVTFIVLIAGCFLLLLTAGPFVAMRATVSSAIIAISVGVTLGPLGHNHEMMISSLFLLYLFFDGLGMLVVMSAYSALLILVLNYRYYLAGTFELDGLTDSIFIVAVVSLITIFLKQSIDHNLREKTTLLRELHHRTKNSMQFIAGYLYQEKKSLKNRQLEESFANLEARIRGIAYVHQKLYSSGTSSQVRMDEYIPELVRLILNCYLLPSQEVKTVYDLDEVESGYDTAITCGLVINELISNSCKHAFLGSPDDTITISMKKLKRKMLRIIVSDNGVGIKEGSNLVSKGSAGIKTTVEIVEKQLKGSIKFSNHSGTTCTLIFRNR